MQSIVTSIKIIYFATKLYSWIIFFKNFDFFACKYFFICILLSWNSFLIYCFSYFRNSFLRIFLIWTLIWGRTNLTWSWTLSFWLFQSFIFLGFFLLTFLSFSYSNHFSFCLIENIFKIFLWISNHWMMSYKNDQTFSVSSKQLFSFFNIQNFSHVSIFCFWIFSDSVNSIFLRNSAFIFTIFCKFVFS